MNKNDANKKSFGFASHPDNVKVKLTLDCKSKFDRILMFGIGMSSALWHFKFKVPPLLVVHDV